MKQVFLVFLVSLGMLSAKADVVTIDIRGGLGNQMWMIAAASAIAWDHGYTPIFERKLDFDTRVGRRPSYWDTMLWQVPTSEKVDYTYNLDCVWSSRDYREITLDRPGVRLQGHFASHKFFDHYKDRICQLFAPSPEDQEYIDRRFAELTKDHDGDVVMVHFRLEDEYTHPHFDALRLWDKQFQFYYTDAVNSFDDNSLFLVFGYPNAIAKEFWQEIFDGQNKKARFVADKDYIELHLMAKCDHHIIANSSFSWWGAYMGKSLKQIVYCPLQFNIIPETMMRPHMYPESWIKVDVLGTGLDAKSTL